MTYQTFFCNGGGDGAGSGIVVVEPDWLALILMDADKEKPRRGTTSDT